MTPTPGRLAAESFRVGRLSRAVRTARESRPTQTLLRSLLPLLAFLAATRPLTARTITLTAEDCDRMAVIAAHAPRASWACCQLSAKVFDTVHALQFSYGQDMALLMRFPLDQIPKGQRITKAELTIEATFVDGPSKVQLRRLLVDWGNGVCHVYRKTYPAKVAWTQACGRGDANDRANRDTAVFDVRAIGIFTADVTEDIELWYTGAGANHGWIMHRLGGGHIQLPSPYGPSSGSGKQWKLQITFEPK